MESSRIFVRGLPPNLTADDFRLHFSKQAAITDAKYIPHRRIGYVGYKTYDEAARAVKYFNKSFIRMSRIGVELARSIEEQNAFKTGNYSGHDSLKLEGIEADSERSNRVKRKREGLPEHGEMDPKLQEFLEVMQPPSKSKTWANEDTAKIQSLGLPADGGARVEKEGKSDGEYEHVPKKVKKSTKAAHVDSPKGQVTTSDAVGERPLSKGKRPNGIESVIAVSDIVSGETVQNMEIPVPTASDEDWLRSRTSRLLGLVDEDVALNTRSSGNDSPVGARPASPDNPQTSDVGIQTHDESRAGPTTTSTLSTDGHGDRRDTNNDTGRLFVRNLSYTTSEDDLRMHFETHGFGPIEEVHIPTDIRSGANKGFAYIQFTEPGVANNALQQLDGKSLHGRLLHVIPAAAKRQSSLDEYAISKLPLKKQQEIKRKAEASSSTFNWNSMYMNSDAVISSISDRLGISKSDLLDPTMADAAVKQAHAETHVIQETKAYFAANGVNLDAFQKKEKGETAILVKNFSYGTRPEELKGLFASHGNITRILMPPSGTIAIVEFEQANQARSAFGSLAYRKFKDSILFLEKAPRDMFSASNAPLTDSNVNIQLESTRAAKPSATELLEEDGLQQPVDTSTLFVRNLNFVTTTDRLRQIFQPLDGFLSARVKKKPDPKKAGQLLSMGFGFLEFRSKQQAQAALSAMDGYKLDGHDLLIRASHKAIDAAEERRKEDRAKKISSKRTKIIIKNLPFEASKKDIRSLFGSYGQLRSVRVPKKFDSSTRGFAFADFVTAREAENAIDALKDTHLLGRRLVLEFAAADEVDPEKEIEKMQKKVGRQADKVALQKLTGTGRRRFTVEGSEDVDVDR